MVFHKTQRRIQCYFQVYGLVFVYSTPDMAGFRSLRRDADTSFCPLAHCQLRALLFDVMQIVRRRRKHFFLIVHYQSDTALWHVTANLSIKNVVGATFLCILLLVAWQTGKSDRGARRLLSVTSRWAEMYIRLDNAHVWMTCQGLWLNIKLLDTTQYDLAIRRHTDIPR
jgi:hypothetical protein